jgi:hypothetical protein
LTDSAPVRSRTVSPASEYVVVAHRKPPASAATAVPISANMPARIAASASKSPPSTDTPRITSSGKAPWRSASTA